MDKSRHYIDKICSVQPNRRTGSAGNREATDYLVETFRSLGCEIDATPFQCLDFIVGGVEVSHKGTSYEAHISPYSLDTDTTAELVMVSTIENLEEMDCENKILLMTGEICNEQLMPKNFIFYNPAHHQKIITLLENGNPAAIITATDRNPEQVGALYPYPLFVDGDFDIPSVYCRRDIGEELGALQGELIHLKIDAQRVKSDATNVIARINPNASGKVVITAHIDAYEETPGALDNASGISVLLLLAEMLAKYQGEYGIELTALNGEDHYSVGGQMQYLRRYRADFPDILLLVNIDGIGYQQGGSAYSFYECPQEIELQVETTFERYRGLLPGEQWYSGDHMIFVQNEVPSLAITSEMAHEMMSSIVHTSADSPDIIESSKIVEVAEALADIVCSLKLE